MALSQLIEQTPHISIIIIAACLLTVFSVKFLRVYFSPQSRRLRNLPVVSEKDDAQLRKSLAQAFQEYSKNGEYYKLNEESHPVIIMPPKAMSEIKALPQSQVSFSEEIYERFNGEMTAMGRFEPSFIKTISGDLTKRIPRIMDELAEETEYSLKELVGEGSGSTAITMLPAAQRIIAILSSRVFAGSQLAHNEKWLNIMITHTNNAFSCSKKIWKFPIQLRPYIAPFFKDFKDMAANRAETERMLAPLISARQKAAFFEDTDDEEIDDILQRLIKNAPADKKNDVSYHAHNQLEMSAAGIHTTAQVMTQVIFNLAAYPEYYEELRQELHEVLRQHYTESRTLVMTKPDLTKLVKLDSFMKETQRTNPLGVLSVNRKVMAPNGLTLSNGLHLPHGTFTAVNSFHIMNDADLYPEPEKFDGFRFAKLHAKGGIHTTKHQFTTVNPEFAAFGQGTHSCPGRFFAAAEMKMVIAHILLNYNVAFEPGQTRPQNHTRGTLQTPNEQAKVVFTPRADAWSLAGDSE